MADDFPWEDFQNRGLDPAAVRCGSGFHCRIVSWHGPIFVLNSGTELVPTLMQGAAFAIAPGFLSISPEVRQVNLSRMTRLEIYADSQLSQRTVNTEPS